MKRREFLKHIAKANAAFFVVPSLSLTAEIEKKCGPITRESEWSAKEHDARQLVFCEYETLCVLASRDRMDSDRYKRLLHLHKLF